MLSEKAGFLKYARVLLLNWMASWMPLAISPKLVLSRQLEMGHQERLLGFLKSTIRCELVP